VCSDVVINAAAYTAVDKAESEPDKAEQVNAHTPSVIAEVSAEIVPDWCITRPITFSMAAAADAGTKTIPPVP